MNNSKIVSTKKTNAIFLAIVLVAGTITAISPSFITGANAQAQTYYGYNSYGPPEYPSFKPDYKPTYPSYGKDNRDKSKDSSNIINKIKCTTNNIVVNGNNTGDINIGNKGGLVTEEGDWSSSSSGNGGYGYDNNKKDKGFECIIKNNNIINNIVAGAGGNVTDGNVTDTCEECFLDALGPEGLAQFETYLATAGFPVPENLIAFCTAIQGSIAGGLTPAQLATGLTTTFNAAGIVISVPEIDALVACLIEVLG